MSSSENWNLFGYDLSQTASGFGNAWKEFLWAERSPVLEALDEVTEVSLDDEGTQFYRAGAPISAPANPAAVQARAVVLPARLLLEKQLKVPQAAEASLDAIIALEVTANSPFPELDTCTAGQSGSARRRV